MENILITHLKSIKIEKLWDEIDINWELDKKVNILIGKNGTGKTTLLNLIESVIREQYDAIASCYAIELLFNDDKTIRATSAKSDTTISGRWVSELVGDNISVSENERFSISFNTYAHNILPQDDASNGTAAFDKYINLSKISTFELSLKDLFSAKNQQHPEIKTELDILTKELIDKFKNYQLKLINLEKNEITILDKEIKQLSQQESASNQELEKLRMLISSKDQKIAEINRQKNLFIEKINLFFEDSGKKLDFDQDNAIVFKKKDKIISAYNLSSGEKQLLIILLTLLLQENKPFIVLMDEPEVSLHVSWQLDLIETLQELNTNCQLIIATHSPGLFAKGWKDKIFKMEDIIEN